MGVSLAWLGVEHPSQWRVGVALYVLGREFFWTFSPRIPD